MNPSPANNGNAGTATVNTAILRKGTETVTGKSIQTSDSHGPSVKPLEWYSDPMAFPAPTWGAQSSFGRFIIEEVSASDTPAYEVRYTPHHLISITDSLDDAKAAAQADYEKRILSALDPSAFEAQERLIETLTASLEKIHKEATVANDVIRLNRDGSGQGRVKVATAMHRVAKLSEAALAQARKG